MPTRLCIDRCGQPAVYRGRCQECAAAREAATHSNKAFYNSRAWQMLRRRVLYEQPICQHCDNALAVDVDHIVPIEQGGQRLTRANCQALCKRCHSQKTRRERS
jgi:5-methylcytosine-specific restriction endonuclease McrA